MREKVIHVTVGTDKPLVRPIVVRRLSVDKGQVMRSGVLDTSFSLRVLLLKNGLTQELKIVFLNVTFNKFIKHSNKCHLKLSIVYSLIIWDN